MHPAGLLAWFILNTFPSVLLAGQWFEVSVKVRVKLPLTNLTATGIAPDLHRTSLLIPFVAGTKYSAKMVVEYIKNKLLSVCQNIISYLSSQYPISEFTAAFAFSKRCSWLPLISTQGTG